jgi:hypothetical protein
MKGQKLTLKERLVKLESDKLERRRLCKAFCDHLEEGLSKESFSIVHHQTIERYMKVYPEEFPQEEIELSQLRGREFWERLGRRQASGDCLGNSRTWYYNMANRYGWREKIDIEAEHKGSVNVNVVSYVSSKKASQYTEDSIDT